MARLSTGALLRYLRGNVEEKATLQVLGMKLIDNKAGEDNQNRRYRLMLSDGKNTFSSCMLGSQLNSLIDNSELKENSIVRIEKCMCNVIDRQAGKFVLMIADLSVVVSTADKIGDPVVLPLTNISNNNLPTKSEPQDDIVVPNTTAPASKTNVIRQGSNVLPTADRLVNGKKGGNTNNTNNNNSNSTKPERIFTIDMLNPYQNKWTIRARVTNKTAVRTWENARGKGQLFSCDLCDETGEIRATAFGSDCDKFFPMLEIGNVYYITKGTLKTANKQYNQTNNDYEMTFNHDTLIEACTEQTQIPETKFNFIPISEIAQRDPNSIVDVIGIVKSVSDIQRIVGKQSQKEFTKRDILLMDDKAKLSVTLWGQQAEEFDGSSNPVLAIKGAKISDFNGRTLSCLQSSIVKINPNIQEAHEIRTWYDNEGFEMDVEDLSTKTDRERMTPFKTIGQITSEQLGSNDKPDYITCKAICLMIKKDSVVYMSCPAENCSKKVIDNGDGTFRCEKCNASHENFKWSYMANAEISDSTGSQWITLFRNEAEALFGITPEEFGQMKSNNDEEAINAVVTKAQNNEKMFKLRIKIDNYNDEQRLRVTCVNISDVEYVNNVKQLLVDINQLTAS